MEIIGDNTCVTSLRPKAKVVYCRGEQHKYWLELQFVDESNNPVSGLNVRLEYHPLASAADVAMWKKHFSYDFNPTPPPNPPAGVTDSQGLVRFDDLYWVAVDIKTDGQQLADIMAERSLGLRRNPNSQPESNNYFQPATRNPSWRSDVQEKAEAVGHLHHYVTIGELCDRIPEITGWTEPEPPAFHFPPGRSLKGTEITREGLEQRHVIEICPFRAWVLALHDTKDYDLSNGLNLGIMADLVYTAEAMNPAIDYFFRKKCQDLSCIPQFAEFPSYFHTLAVDVPFYDRYQPPFYLNTGEGPTGKGDTRLFTVECGTHLLVAWCGTDSLLNILTDLSFGPKSCLPELAAAGNVHGGFLEAYDLAKRQFGDKLSLVQASLAKGGKKLYVCGHSLGGALALLYAAEMKDSQPVLYTYGMPRSFTRAAIVSLGGITHHRHVNDNDTITQIPPDADLDNAFYRTWGPLGDKLGFDWALTTAAGLSVAVRDLTYQSAGLVEKRDPYWHHGNTVIFLRAQQHLMQADSPYQKNPIDGQVYSRHLVTGKLFLVPSLNNECLKSTGEHQAAFIQCLNPASLAKTFPNNSNPKLNGLGTDPRSHSMAHRYLPYIHNQVLELADPSLEMSRKAMRERFREVVEKDASGSNTDEVERNCEFLALQDMLPVTLKRLLAEETGKNALTRFAAVTEEEVEFSQ
ncbi:lipase family protein [Erwinia billingiae]|uniref:lipase family protein n=1 Tax=Erwinia billingiae TaxID=182337 RepID=UPI0022470B41|nr:lipase family protein [Erwinia billingiae]MCX0498432.1 lipase family protein [Erwinia billingiae]